MTTITETLIASLTATQNDTDAVYLAGNRYFDWSSTVDAGDGITGRIFEVGNGVDTVQLTLNRSEVLRLHAALTLTLLANQD